MGYRRGRIVTAEWAAEFVSDGTMRKSDEPIAFMRGWTDERIRAHCAEMGWKLTRVLTDQAERDPLVRQILAAFPGAEVVAVRPPPSDRLVEAADSLFEHEEPAHEGV